MHECTPPEGKISSGWAVVVVVVVVVVVAHVSARQWRQQENLCQSGKLELFLSWLARC